MYLADGTKQTALNTSGESVLYLGSLVYRKHPVHYIEIKDKFGRTTATPPEEGWEGNIMASNSGEVEQRNIDDILRGIFKERNDKSWFLKLFEDNNHIIR